MGNDLKYILASALFVSCPSFVAAQGTISTVAGGSFLDNIPAIQARISGIGAVVVDQGGNAYLGDGTRIRRIDARTAIISTVTTATGGEYLALDPAGKVWIISNSQLQKLDLTSGVLTKIAGSPGSTTPQFGSMAGIATDVTGNAYLTDWGGKIYRIDAVSGTVTTIAGTGPVSNNGIPRGDGVPATLAGLLSPSAIAVDSSGHIFFAEQDWLRRIDGKTGIITTIAPQLHTVAGSSGDGGPVAKAVFGNISALATDSKGNLFIADGRHLRKIDWTTGIVSTIAGSGMDEYMPDGVPALQANLSSISGLVADARNNIWIADQGNARLFLVSSATGLIQTVAGTSANGDGGPAVGALLERAVGLAADSHGDLYLSAGRLRRINRTTGIISTVPLRGLDLAQGALGASPIALDSVGNIYVSTPARLQRVDAATGEVSTIAGSGVNPYGGGPLGDGGPATSAQLTSAGVAFDSRGNAFVADYFNARIRRIDAATGTITTVAGNGGRVYSGQTGPATSIAIGIPTSIAIGPDGDVYWSTSGSVLKMAGSGLLSLVAGNGGGCVYSGDGGPATMATVCDPSALAFDGSGNLLISDSSCGCVRMVSARTGIIQTVAGTGKPGNSGDSIPATTAQLTPGAIAMVGGTMYVVDVNTAVAGGPSRIRAVTLPIPPPLPQPPNITEIGNAIDLRTFYSPGAIVALFGNYLGPSTPATALVGANATIPSALSGDKVTFNGVPAPLLYVSAGQINAVVPYSLRTGNGTVQVTTGAGTATFEDFRVSNTSLAFFPDLVFNPDGSLNSSSNPAPKGGILVMYGSGMGQTNPAGVDGGLALGPSYPSPVATFTANILAGNGSYKGKLLYLGALPGFIAGAVQANIQIPDTVPAGQSALVIAPVNGAGALSQKIYMLGDAPVLTGISPSSPIPQVPGIGNNLTLSGINLVGIENVSFTLNGQPADVHPQMFQPCTAISCTVFTDFAGVSGFYTAAVTNAARQVSNELPFTVVLYSAPNVSEVRNSGGTGPVQAFRGLQFVNISGTGFLAPVTVNVYFQGTRMATLSASSPISPQVYNPQLIQIPIDLQGNAGTYGIEVMGANGASPIFNFEVVSP